MEKEVAVRLELYSEGNVCGCACSRGVYGSMLIPTTNSSVWLTTSGPPSVTPFRLLRRWLSSRKRCLEMPRIGEAFLSTLGRGDPGPAAPGRRGQQRPAGGAPPLWQDIPGQPGAGRPGSPGVDTGLCGPLRTGWRVSVPVATLPDRMALPRRIYANTSRRFTRCSIRHASANLRTGWSGACCVAANSESGRVRPSTGERSATKITVAEAAHRLFVVRHRQRQCWLNCMGRSIPPHSPIRM